MNGRRGAGIIGVALAFFFYLNSPVLYAENLDRYFEEEEAQNMETAVVAPDPLEPVNRVFFSFNDKLYFWVLKPVSTVYAACIHKDFRIAIRNAFHNLLEPVIIVNNFLQGKVGNSGTELVRFVINTTVGVGGLADVAETDFHLKKTDEDLGQTFGFYGAGEGIYFCWPFLGPSNLRDTVGLVGDGFISPANYLFGGNIYSTLGLKSEEKVNDVSLRLGDYESFKKAAVDPYVSMREAYRQTREKKINDRLQYDGDGGNDNSTVSSVKEIDQGIYPGNSAMPPTAEERSRSGHPGRFAVHLVLAVDEKSAQLRLKDLHAEGIPAIVVEYRRADYVFFGIEVPVDGDFAIAKSEELRYVSLGYRSAMVVGRKT